MCSVNFLENCIKIVDNESVLRDDVFVMKTTKAPSTTRTRTRKLDVSKDESKKLETMIAEVFALNKQMNEAKTKHDKLRRELFSQMKTKGLDHLSAIAMLSTGEVPVEALIQTPEGQAVDATKLSGLIPLSTFLEVVTVSQKAVIDKLGTAMLNQVLVPTKGTENVVVRVIKA